MKGGIASKGMYVMRRFIEETLEEAKDYPSDLIEEQMVKASMTLYWVGTGRIPENAAPDIIALIERYAPEMLPVEMSATEIRELESAQS